MKRRLVTILVGVLAAYALGAPRSFLRPAIGDKSPERAAQASRVDGGPDSLLRRAISVDADDRTVEETVALLRDERAVPVKLAKSLDIARRHVSLHVHGATVEATLSAVAAAFGDGYRWRQHGQMLVLEAVDGGRWSRSLSGEPASGLREALAEAGLLIAPQTPAYRAASVRSAQAPQRFAEELSRSLSPGAAAQAAPPGGLPVRYLPRDTQQAAYRLLVESTRDSRTLRSASAAQRLLENPLLTGRAPTDVRVLRNGATWRVSYSTRPGARDTFTLGAP